MWSVEGSKVAKFHIESSGKSIYCAATWNRSFIMPVWGIREEYLRHYSMTKNMHASMRVQEDNILCYNMKQNIHLACERVQERGLLHDKVNHKTTQNRAFILPVWGTTLGCPACHGSESCGPSQWGRRWKVAPRHTSLRAWVLPSWTETQTTKANSS